MQIIPPPPKGYTWESLMCEALTEAEAAQKKDEVPVGAVIVSKQGEILAKAHNRTRIDTDSTAHAEIIAIRKACKKVKNFRLLDTFIVVTLEPCIMCLGAIREARITGIVFALHDKDVGAVCSCIDGTELILKSPKPWFMSGVCEEESRLLLQDFFKNKRN